MITSTEDQKIVKQTETWIREVVIGCNFCPFAGRELKRGSIHYHVIHSNEHAFILISLSEEFNRLDTNTEIETTLIILPGLFPDFNKFLDLVALCQIFLNDQKKEGIYQIASFHPDYLFAGTTNNDPANFTNRSLYPMIHLLRESSITAALA